MTIDDPTERGSDPLLLVVGFDGSEAATRALDAATRLMSGRVGSIEVVFVAHTPPVSELSAEALLETLNAFDDVEHDLAEAARSRLEGVGPRWGFRRRNGLIADELAAVADELRRDDGDDAIVVIVVGSAEHAYHHFVGSVPVGLVRHAKYPIIVVP
jgi:nucleotide-binding universal stress UspA family protein